MNEFSLHLRDLLWFGSLLVTVVLAYGRVRTELRHLDDIKTNRDELHAIGGDLRTRLEDIRMSVTRVEVALQHRNDVPPDPAE